MQMCHDDDLYVLYENERQCKQTFMIGQNVYQVGWINKKWQFAFILFISSHIFWIYNKNSSQHFLVLPRVSFNTESKQKHKELMQRISTDEGNPIEKKIWSTVQAARSIYIYNHS